MDGWACMQRRVNKARQRRKANRILTSYGASHSHSSADHLHDGLVRPQTLAAGFRTSGSSTTATSAPWTQTLRPSSDHKQKRFAPQERLADGFDHLRYAPL